MRKLRTYSLMMFGLAICIAVYKHTDNPTTIASDKGLVIPKEWLLKPKKRITPYKDVRWQDQTFLTFPEWNLVFSPKEQAEYLTTKTATSFPYVAQTHQIWESYKIIKDQVKDVFPVNKEYHFMIWVIGLSSSAEFLMKSTYENSVGRLTDTGDQVTAEDKFAAEYAENYVKFIEQYPWYEFDFASELSRLWKTTSWWDKHMLRKWERKYFLTSELMVKYLYGKVIGYGSNQMYGTAVLSTAVVFEDSSVNYLPRYQDFTPAIMEAAKQGHRFLEIAGNNSAITLSIQAPKNKNLNLGNAVVIFKQPMIKEPKVARYLIAIDVPHLHDVLVKLDQQGVFIEHVFDF